MRHIDLAVPEGRRWIPDLHQGDGVLVLAGSSGRIDSDRARLFAEFGCVAESIRWFGGPEQHGGPWEIPLETFLGRIDDLKNDCERVYVVGTSFGSEAALLSGALSDSVTGVIAFAPSDVVWAGYDEAGRETSHWTLDGHSLPFVPFDWDAYVEEQPARFLPGYTHSRAAFSDRMTSSTIAVERIRELVIVAGGDDQVWPSLEQAARIQSLRQAAGLHTVLVSEPHAGHRTILPGEPVIVGGMTMRRGGTDDADRRLGTRAWRAIRNLLEHHRQL